MPESQRSIIALAAEILGSASLAGKIRPDEISVCGRFAVDELAQVAARHSGTVHESAGLHLTALFGTPVMYEDDPEKAVKAARAMIEAICKVSDMLTQMFRTRVELGVRIGISRGISIVRLGGGDERRQFAVIGDTVNLAAELRDSAQAGEILVTEAVFRASRYMFDFEALPSVHFKAAQELIAVFRPRREKKEPGPKHGIKGFSSPLVGRGQDLEMLQGRVSALQERRGGMVLVLGEQGIGKSRLWFELKALITDRHLPITVLESSCLSYGATMAHWPFIQILQRVFDIEPSDAGEVVKKKLLTKTKELFPKNWEKIVPYIGCLFSVRFTGEIDDRVRHLEAQDLRLQILLAVRDTLLALAKDRPLLVVIDDYQWIDHASLELLEFILSNSETGAPGRDKDAKDLFPILFVALSRIEKNQEFWPSWQRLKAKTDRQFLEITLSPLDHELSGDLIRNLLRIDDMPGEFRSKIIERAAGNPFYLEEILRSLVDSKIIVLDLGIWNLKEDVSTIDVPRTIQTAILSRLDRLPKEERAILERASVIGRLFLEQVLTCLTAIDRATLAVHLAALEDLEYITVSRKEPQVEYMFKHPLTQEVVYNSLPKERLTALHGQVGASIEKIFPNSIGNFTEMLSHQYYAAEDWPKAYEYSMKSAQKAKQTFLNKNALSFYDRALSSIRISDQERRESQVEKAIQTMKDKVEVLHLIGENEPALAEIKKGLHIARKLVDRKSEADFLLLMSDVYGAISDYAQMLDSARQSHSIYQEVKDLKGQTRALNNIGVVYDNLGNYGQALHCYNQALKIHADAGDQEGEAVCLNNIGHLHNNLGNYDQALVYYDQSLKIFEKLGNRKEIAIALDNVGAINSTQGNYAKALEYHTQSLRVKEEIGDRWGEAVSLNNIGYIYGLQADYARALEYHEQSLRVKEEIGDRWGKTGSLNNLAAIHAILGDRAKALNYYNQSLEISDKISYLTGKAVSLNGMATLFTTQGIFAEAREYLRKADSIVNETGSKELIRRVAVSHAELELAEYGQSIAKILARAHELGIDIIVDKKMVTVTDLESLGNRQLALDDAQRHLQDAHEYAEKSFKLAEELKVRPRRAEALILQARVDIADANWPRAETRFREALTIFEELSQPLELAKAYFYHAEGLEAMGKEKGAEEYHQKAKALFDKIGAKGWAKKTAV